MCIFYVFLFCLLLVFGSCTRFDTKTPDASANRKGFETHLGFPPAEEVTEVYFYADEWGGDAKYLLAFKAPSEVVDRIVREQGLKPATTCIYAGDQERYPWWDPQVRRLGRCYALEDEQREILCYLWYEPESRRCQYCLIYY